MKLILGLGYKNQCKDMVNYAILNDMGKEIPLCDVSHVLHFYQGADVLIKEGRTWFLDVAHIISYQTDGGIEVWGDNCECVTIKEFKFLLRKIENMTEDEEAEYYELCKKILHLKNPEDKKENILTTADSGESFAWLIQNRFDCFRLIERAIAFDKDNLPKNVKIQSIK